MRIDAKTKLNDLLKTYPFLYLKKENQHFPLLEDHNVSGPNEVMGAIHDDVRALQGQRKVLDWE